MNTKIRRKDKKQLSTERLLIIGMIVSDSFLKRIQTYFSAKLLEGKYAAMVGRWCLDYWKKYKKAPNRTIKEIYLEKTSKVDFDEDTKDLIEYFLTSIDEEYDLQDKFNVDYALENSIKYLKRRELQILSDDIKALIERGEQEKADSLITKYKDKKTELLNFHTYYDPIKDKEVHKRAFENKQKPPLFTYSGRFGSMINRYLTRDSLIALLSPEKTGKSFWKLEFSVRALRQRNNIAVFQAGDMSEDEWDQRLMSYLTRKPIIPSPEDTLIPIMDCAWNQDNSCKKKIRTCRMGVIIDPEESMETIPFGEADGMGYQICTVCQTKHPDDYKPAVWFQKGENGSFDLGDADKAFGELNRQAKGKRMLISTHSYNTLSPKMINSILDEWEETEHFIPDVILIDYAGILESDRGKDEREKENEKWKDLRMLSQTRHALVITSLQSNRGGYKNDLDKEHVSIDKRILGHVVALFSLNQTEKEKEKGIIRIGQVVGRHTKYTYKVTVLQCLDISRAFLGSF